MQEQRQPTLHDETMKGGPPGLGWSAHPRGRSVGERPVGERPWVALWFVAKFDLVFYVMVDFVGVKDDQG